MRRSLQRCALLPCCRGAAWPGGSAGSSEGPFPLFGPRPCAASLVGMGRNIGLKDRATATRRESEGALIPVLVAVQMLAQFLQRVFTQEIGIALAGLGKFNDALCDDSVRKMTA